MFEIIKNLPIPEKQKNKLYQRRESKYPFETMEIGDCLAFSATGLKDPAYKNIYSAAMGFVRRNKKDFSFRFAQIEENKFGCWKIESNKYSNKDGESSTKSKSSRKERINTSIITKDMLLAAFEHEGTVIGASRLLNISSRTFTRLKQKFNMV